MGHRGSQVQGTGFHMVIKSPKINCVLTQFHLEHIKNNKVLRSKEKSCIVYDLSYETAAYKFTIEKANFTSSSWDSQ